MTLVNVLLLTFNTLRGEHRHTKRVSSSKGKPLHTYRVRTAGQLGR